MPSSSVVSGTAVMRVLRVRQLDHARVTGVGDVGDRPDVRLEQRREEGVGPVGREGAHGA